MVELEAREARVTRVDAGGTAFGFYGAGRRGAHVKTMIRGSDGLSVVEQTLGRRREVEEGIDVLA